MELLEHQGGAPAKPAPAPPGGMGGRLARVLWPVALFTATLTLALLSILIGSGPVGPSQALAYLLGRPEAVENSYVQMVITTLRLPRTLAALIVGAALGTAGALMQAVTRNPLAETGLLGVNAGAALGVVLGLTYMAQTGSGYAYLAWAFGGALAASLAVLAVAAAGKVGASPLRLVLAGAALGATFRGLTSYILVTNAAVYDEYRFWMLGTVAGASLERALEMVPAVACGLVLAALVTKPLSALFLGDDVARALGHRPGLIRVVVSLAVTLLTAAAVAMAGPISFLGLIAPHLARALVGPRLGQQIALSMVAGAGILLAADILSRVIIRPHEAPVSVLLAYIGAPLLILIARSNRLLTLQGPGGRNA